MSLEFLIDLPRIKCEHHSFTSGHRPEKAARLQWQTRLTQSMTLWNLQHNGKDRKQTIITKDTFEFQSSSGC